MGRGHYNPNIEDCEQFCLEPFNTDEEGWEDIRWDEVLRYALPNPDAWWIEVDWHNRRRTSNRDYPRDMFMVLRRRDGVCIGLADNQTSTMVVVWSDGTYPGIGEHNAWKLHGTLRKTFVGDGIFRVTVPIDAWTSAVISG